MQTILFLILLVISQLGYPVVSENDNQAMQNYFTALETDCDYLNDYLTHIADQAVRERTQQVGTEYCNGEIVVYTTHLPVVTN